MKDEQRALFEEMFSFEQSAIPLLDGTWFQPLRDSKQRWAIFEDKPIGTYYNALYQMNDDQFVLLKFWAERPRYPWRRKAIKQCDRDISGERVSSETAFEFLRGEFEIPDALQGMLLATSPAEATSEQLVLARPFEFWMDNIPSSYAKNSAHELRVVDLLPLIHQAATRAVQEIRTWSKLPYGSRSHIKLIQLLFNLVQRYRVDPKNWWGDKKIVPPDSVDLLELQWPAGVDALTNNVIPELRELTINAITVLYSCSSVTHCESATDEEVQLAEEHLVYSLPKIEELTVLIGVAIEELESGAVHKRLQEDAPKNCKPANDVQLAAYLLCTMGLEIKEIKSKLSITAHSGTVSRWIEIGRQWIASGNPLPPSIQALVNAPTTSATPVHTVDPAQLDIGKRKDGRRNRSTPKD